MCVVLLAFTNELANHKYDLHLTALKLMEVQCFILEQVQSIKFLCFLGARNISGQVDVRYHFLFFLLYFFFTVEATNGCMRIAWVKKSKCFSYLPSTTTSTVSYCSSVIEELGVCVIKKLEND